MHRGEVHAFTSQGLPEDVTRREDPPSLPRDAGTSAPVPSRSSPRAGVTAPSVMTGLADPDQAQQRVTRAVRLAEAGMCPAATSKQEGCPESPPSSLLSFQGGGRVRAGGSAAAHRASGWNGTQRPRRPVRSHLLVSEPDDLGLGVALSPAGEEDGVAQGDVCVLRLRRDPRPFCTKKESRPSWS